MSDDKAIIRIGYRTSKNPIEHDLTVKHALAAVGKATDLGAFQISGGGFPCVLLVPKAALVPFLAQALLPSEIDLEIICLAPPEQQLVWQELSPEENDPMGPYRVELRR